MAKRVLFAPNTYITYLAFLLFRLGLRNNNPINLSFSPNILICHKLPYLLNGISLVIKDVKIRSKFNKHYDIFSVYLSSRHDDSGLDMEFERSDLCENTRACLDPQFNNYGLFAFTLTYFSAEQE